MIVDTQTLDLGRTRRCRNLTAALLRVNTVPSFYNQVFTLSILVRFHSPEIMDLDISYLCSRELGALRLLSLLHFLVGPLRQLGSWLLASGGTPRKRWTSFGGLETFHAHNIGLDQARLASGP